MIRENRIFKILFFLIQNPIQNLVIFGILLRLFLFSIFYSTVTIFPDSDGYLELAKYISALDLKGYNGLRSPGYSIFISLLRENLYAVVFFQFVLGILGSVLWFKTFVNFNFTKTQSFLTTIFISSFLNVFFFETCILVESFVLFILSLLIYFLSNKSFENTSFINQLKLSFTFAFLVLVKPFFAYLPFIFVAFILYKKRNLQTLTQSLVLISLSLFSYFGWCFVNEKNIGSFVPASCSGLVYSQNCVYFAEKSTKEYEWISKPYTLYREKVIRENKDPAMTIWIAYEDGAYDKYHLTLPQLSLELGKFAKSTILNNPLDYIKQVLFRSWFDFWKPTIYWNYDQFNFKYGNTLLFGFWCIQYLVLAVFKLSFVLLLPYYGYDLIKNKKLTMPLQLIIIVFSTSILQALITFGNNNRFSFPFEFIMIFVVLNFIKEKEYLKKYFE